MSYNQDRDATIAALTECGASLATCRGILAAATTLQRISELTCSVEMSERETARLERREANAEERVHRLAATFGARADFNGDPRGYVVRLILPSGKYNTWGGAESGWGVAARGYPASRFGG